VVFEDIYTLAVFAFQALLQCAAFGLIGGGCDLHRTSWTVTENSEFGGVLAIGA